MPFNKFISNRGNFTITIERDFVVFWKEGVTKYIPIQAMKGVKLRPLPTHSNMTEVTFYLPEETFVFATTRKGEIQRFIRGMLR
jgi:hypothetical protein